MQLNFQFDVLGEWQWFEIIGYFAFVNQVAGIRKVRKIEIDALEHFIFSGSDIKLSVEENLLLDAWWNYTIVSCVANICDEFKYPVYDSIIFWYNLNIRRIQLLFKDHHGMEGKDFIESAEKIKAKIDIGKYDTQIQLQLKGHIDDHEIEKVKTMSEEKSVEINVVTPPRDRMVNEDEDENQNGNENGNEIEEEHLIGTEKEDMESNDNDVNEP